MDKFQTLREKDNPSNNVYPNIQGSNIPSGAVTTDKIADFNVTENKIAQNAVTSGKINNSAVTTDKLANNAVTTAKITDGSVTNGKIANGAITGSKIDPASIQAIHMDITKVSLSSVIEDITTIAELVTRLKALMRLPFARLYWDYANAYADIDISVFELVGSYRVVYSKSDLSGVNTFTTDADALSFITTAQDIAFEYLE